MITVLATIISGVIFFILGWFLSKKIQKSESDALFINQEKKHEETRQQLLEEQAIISDQFYQANKLDLLDKEQKLNNAFLTNGQTIEVIASEMKEAENLVTNAFASLPNIYTCSQRSHQATQDSKAAIEALSQSVNAWQGTINVLENVQGLIDAIHDKATQIRDVSSEANLLALNASIEAARAGDHGRGFAVVATSMRELSIKSADATVDISTAVDSTREEVSKITADITDSITLLTQVSSGVETSFAGIENEVSMIDSIAQTSLSEAETSKDKFESINSQVMTQLENITRLLADTIGEVTGNKVEDITVSEDFSTMKIIDVRRPDEFIAELGHIPGAESMCLQDGFDQQLQKLNKNKPYLFVCRSGGRSARAARVALGLGFKFIYNMKGGMLEYCKVMGTPENASMPIPEMDISDDVLF